MRGDGLDEYRKEYNKMLLEKAVGSDSMVQEKYVTVSIYKKSIEEARAHFTRIGAELGSHFSRLGSKCVELGLEDRLRILHDFYRAGEETGFSFELLETMQKGHSFRDFICPDSLEFEQDCFRMGGTGTEGFCSCGSTPRTWKMMCLRCYVKLYIRIWEEKLHLCLIHRKMLFGGRTKYLWIGGIHHGKNKTTQRNKREQGSQSINIVLKMMYWCFLLLIHMLL